MTRGRASNPTVALPATARPWRRLLAGLLALTLTAPQACPTSLSELLQLPLERLLQLRVAHPAFVDQAARTASARRSAP